MALPLRLCLVLLVSIAAFSAAAPTVNVLADISDETDPVTRMRYERSAFALDPPKVFFSLSWDGQDDKLMSSDGTNAVDLETAGGRDDVYPLSGGRWLVTVGTDRRRAVSAEPLVRGWMSRPHPRRAHLRARGPANDSVRRRSRNVLDTVPFAIHGPAVDTEIVTGQWTDVVEFVGVRDVISDGGRKSDEWAFLGESDEGDVTMLRVDGTKDAVLCNRYDDDACNIARDELFVAHGRLFIVKDTDQTPPVYVVRSWKMGDPDFSDPKSQTVLGHWDTVGTETGHYYTWDTDSGEDGEEVIRAYSYADGVFTLHSQGTLTEAESEAFWYNTRYTECTSPDGVTYFLGGEGYLSLPSFTFTPYAGNLVADKQYYHPFCVKNNRVLASYDNFVTDAFEDIGVPRELHFDTWTTTGFTVDATGLPGAEVYALHHCEPVDTNVPSHHWGSTVALCHYHDEEDYRPGFNIRGGFFVLDVENHKAYPLYLTNNAGFDVSKVEWNDFWLRYEAVVENKLFLTVGNKFVVSVSDTTMDQLPVADPDDDGDDDDDDDDDTSSAVAAVPTAFVALVAIVLALM